MRYLVMYYGVVEMHQQPSPLLPDHISYKCKQCSVKGRFYKYAKSIDTCQPAQADMRRHFSLS